MGRRTAPGSVMPARAAHEAKPRTSEAYAATVCGDNDDSDMAKASTRQTASPSSAVVDAGASSTELRDRGTRSRVFGDQRPDHDTTGSNQPPDSRTQPVRSRRARAIAASAIESASADTTSSNVRGSSWQAANTTASTPRGN